MAAPALLPRRERRPHREEALELFRRKWEALPQKLRRPQQLAGVAAVGCGATHSVMERCNFSCTSCYLSDLANTSEPLPFSEVQIQLEALRRHLGEGGKVQITSGEVTLLSSEDLGKIVSYAKSLGLDPMIMTNGERLLEEPDYLRSLVGDFGLEKISIHVDTTERGRRGMPRGGRERDVHPIRERFARLIQDVRRSTGRPLHAAQTITVTEANLEDVPDVASWALDHADTFRIVSFQPVAAVGRTRDRSAPDVGLDAVWERIGRAAGRPLNRYAMFFGHDACSITVPVIVARFGAARHVVEVVREGFPLDLHVFQWVIRNLSGVVELNEGVAINLARVSKTLLSRPHRLAHLLVYGIYRAWGERHWLRRVLVKPWRVGWFRAHPLLFVVHKFMNAEELETPLGKERLRACVFKLPVTGRMVSMCEVNATGIRRELNAASRSGSNRRV